MSWLPDMDLNHDKQIQSLLCYRYTIGQTGVWHRLGNFVVQSSQQPGSSANGLICSDARPHPSPLPRGEGEVARVPRQFSRHNCNHRCPGVRSKALAATCDVRTSNTRRTILPLLADRAVVTTNIPASRITHHASLF